MKELVVVALVCSLTLFSSTGMAQDTNSDKHRYLGITTGAVFATELEGDVRSPNPVTISSVDLTNGGMLGVKFSHTPEKLSRVITMEV